MQFKLLRKNQKGDVLMVSLRIVSVNQTRKDGLKRVIAATLVIATTFLPFKAKAEELDSAKKGLEVKRSVAAEVFYQAIKGEGHEAGAGLDANIGAGPVNLGFGASVAGNLRTGATVLERATANATFSLPYNLALTTYAQRCRFLGGQRAVGGVFHADLGSVILHTGAEYDLIGKAVPVFVGADVNLGPITVSPTLIVPVVPQRDYPNIGGTLKVSLKTKVVNFFVRAFGMFEPKQGIALAGNVQAGIEIPLGGD